MPWPSVCPPRPARPSAGGPCLPTGSIVRPLHLDVWIEDSHRGGRSRSHFSGVLTPARLGLPGGQRLRLAGDPQGRDCSGPPYSPVVESTWLTLHEGQKLTCPPVAPMPDPKAKADLTACGVDGVRSPCGLSIFEVYFLCRLGSCALALPLHGHGSNRIGGLLRRTVSQPSDGSMATSWRTQGSDGAYANCRSYDFLRRSRFSSRWRSSGFNRWNA